MLRVYFTISTTLTPTVAQWRQLISATKGATFASAVIAAARAAQNFISADKFNQAGTPNQICLGGFEIEDNQQTALLAVLNTEATVLGGTGGAKAQFEAVLEDELRSAALGLGYSQAQADTLIVTVLNSGANQFDRGNAIAAAQAYLAANSADWGVTV